MPIRLALIGLLIALVPMLGRADAATTRQVAAAVNANWTVLASMREAARRDLIVRVGLSPEGDLTALDIVQSSGSQSFDRSLLRAVRRSMPLPIPREQLPEYAAFELTFSP